MRHRVGQGLRALQATVSAVDQSLAQQHLSAQEFKAFQAMSRAEQLHSVQVLRVVLEQQTYTPQTLAAAALLHDVGKSRYHLAIWQKTLAVLVSALIPSNAASLGKDESLSLLRAPFTVSSHHAKWGGEILQNCGSTADVVWLVVHHQDSLEQWRDHTHFELLQQLQTADNTC